MTTIQVEFAPSVRLVMHALVAGKRTLDEIHQWAEEYRDEAGLDAITPSDVSSALLLLVATTLARRVEPRHHAYPEWEPTDEGRRAAGRNSAENATKNEGESMTDQQSPNGETASEGPSSRVTTETVKRGGLSILGGWIDEVRRFRQLGRVERGIVGWTPVRGTPVNAVEHANGIPAPVSADDPEVRDTLDRAQRVKALTDRVECPICGALTGEPCTKLDRGRTTLVNGAEQHVARIEVRYAREASSGRVEVIPPEPATDSGYHEVDIDCPFCDALAGETCTRDADNPIGRSHLLRHAAAAAASTGQSDRLAAELAQLDTAPRAHHVPRHGVGSFPTEKRPLTASAKGRFSVARFSTIKQIPSCTQCGANAGVPCVMPNGKALSSGTYCTERLDGRRADYLDLVPDIALHRVAAVILAGQEEHGDRWKTKGVTHHVLAGLGHGIRHLRGETYDRDLYDQGKGKHSHLACAGARVLMALHLVNDPEDGR